jgi:tetratricopeptide (TPR) repeat protein
MLRYFALFVLCLFNSFAFANDPDLQQEMGQIAEVTNRLYPALLQISAQSKRSELKQVSKDLDALQEHMRNLQEPLAKRPDSVKITYRTMMSQLDEAQAALQHGYIKHSSQLIYNATTLCMGCHSQDHVQKIGLTAHTLDALDDFNRGELYFMTRQYQAADAAFKNYLASRPKLTDDKTTLTAFYRLQVLAFDLLADGTTYTPWLQEIARKPMNIPLRRDIQLWQKGIDYYQEVLRQHDTSAEQLDKLMQANVFENGEAPVYISEQQRPLYIWLRGQLHKMAYQEQGNDPKLLYWLAICDRVLEYGYYYSLADLYLTQCIEGYSATPVAQQCLNEYRNYMIFAYSGSSGTHIPDEMQQELDRLESIVAKAQH